VAKRKKDVGFAILPDRLIDRWFPVALAINADQGEAFARKYKLSLATVSELSASAWAHTQFWYDDNGKPTAALVKVRPGLKRRRVTGSLVHEAVHLWQAQPTPPTGAHNSPDEPGWEFEAYAIQGFFTDLMAGWDALEKLRKRR
jgi:hypothetical protein